MCIEQQEVGSRSWMSVAFDRLPCRDATGGEDERLCMCNGLLRILYHVV